jgi:leucyl/phenylalanyl-tRNA--protein transferase
LELLADFIGGTLRHGATGKQREQIDSAKNAGDFHPGSIEKRVVMAISIPPELLLSAYRRGAFPMAIAPGDIRWFSPQMRGVLPLDGFHVPHGMRRTLKDPAWEIRIDTAFAEVMRACANRKETWIDGVIFESYRELHKLGHAHSVEVWREGKLAGGLYGVAIGAAFFGESMFSRVTNASKVALARLVEILREGGFVLLDTQWVTPHLAQFGVIEVPRTRYLRMLTRAVETQASFAFAQ